MSLGKRILINVGGVRHDVRLETLQKFPGSKLATLTKDTFLSYDVPEEYYFDRNSVYFDIVLDCLRTGELHIPSNLCVNRVQRELEFWKIDSHKVGDCCVHIFSDLEEQERETLEMSKDFGLLTPRDEQIEVSSRRMRLWNFLSNPNSSRAALAWLILYLILVILSIGLTALETDMNLRIFDEDGDGNASLDVSLDASLAQKLGISLNRLLLSSSSKPFWMRIINLICMPFFSVDFLLRLGVCPSRGSFFKDPLNIIDGVWVILAWIIEIMAPFARENINMFVTVILIDGLINSLRVFKILRVASCWLGLRVLLLTLKASIKELFSMIVFLVMGLIIFGTLIYYAELDETDGQFSDIFVGYWWAMVTMTTLGYGDIHPVGTLGRSVGMFCVVIGLVIISMPISIIGNNFCKYVSFSKTFKERKKKKNLKR